MKKEMDGKYQRCKEEEEGRKNKSILQHFIYFCFSSLFSILRETNTMIIHWSIRDRVINIRTQHHYMDLLFSPPFTVANCRTLKYINLFSFVHNVHSFGGMWEHSKILQNMMSKIRFGTKHFVHKYSFVNLDADSL